MASRDRVEQPVQAVSFCNYVHHLSLSSACLITQLNWHLKFEYKLKLQRIKKNAIPQLIINKNVKVTIMNTNVVWGADDNVINMGSIYVWTSSLQ